MDKYQPIGIDLGTTYSAIATLNDAGRPALILNREGERITPSVVLFEDSEVIVGRDAKRAAISDPDRVVQFVKRQMGQPDWAFETSGRRWTASQVSAEILKKLVHDAHAELGAEIREAVITVPAYFAERERTATLEAAKLAGLSALHLINEPTAAALAYNSHRSDHGNVLVYDLGGGTFDVTVLEVNGTIMRVLATEGDVSLGGKDWDDQVISYAAKRFQETHGTDPSSDPAAGQDLRERCERAKEQLSQLAQACVTASYLGRSLRIDLTRDQFDKLTAELLAQTQTTVELVLHAAGLNADRIARVLLVGGSTRMPQVRAMLTRFFGKEPSAAMDADEAVAKGAAVQAALLYSRQLPPNPHGLRAGLQTQLTMRDVTAHSLGTLAYRDRRLVNSIVLRKNTPIPAEGVRRDYVTTEHNQTSIIVPILQGEDDEPELCDLVAAYELTGIPARGAGRSEVEVTFRYDVSGVISLQARDVATGRVLALARREARLAEFHPQVVSQPLDLMFTFDTTGSMYGYLEQVRLNLSQIITEVHEGLPDARIAIMAYGDHCDESSTYLVKSSKFMTDTARLVEFIRDVEKTGGGDAPEAIEDALWTANQSEGAKNSSKALILIGDAPSHSKSECPYGRDYEAEAGKLRDRGVRMYTVLCGNDGSARRQFQDLAHKSGGKFLPLADIKDLCDLLVAIAMREGGRLDVYQAKLLSENRMTSSKKSLLEILDR